MDKNLGAVAMSRIDESRERRTATGAGRRSQGVMVYGRAVPSKDGESFSHAGAMRGTSRAYGVCRPAARARRFWKQWSVQRWA